MNMKKENNTSQRNEMNETHPITALSQNSTSGPHWTSTKYSKNMLIDALAKHLLGLV